MSVPRWRAELNSGFIAVPQHFGLLCSLCLACRAGVRLVPVLVVVCWGLGASATTFATLPLEQSSENEAATPGNNEHVNPLDAHKIFARTISLSATGRTSESCLQELCDQARLEFKPDRQSLRSTSFKLDKKINASFDETPLHEAIVALVNPKLYPEIVAQVRGQTLFLTSAEADRKFRRESTPLWLKDLGVYGVQFDDLGQVWYVDIGSKATDETISRLTELPRLRSLRLSGAGDLTLEGMKVLPRLEMLEKLVLNRFGRPADTKAKFTSDEALEFVGQIDSLRQLFADDCGISDAGVRELKNLSELTVLSLRQNQITDASLPTIGKLKKLTNLDLGCHVRDSVYGKNELSDAGMQHITDLTELEHINVEGTGVSVLRVDSPSLKSLSLGTGFNTPPMTDRDVFLLQRYPELQSLSINSDLVSDTGIAALARLKNLSSLELHCDLVTDSGIERLVALPLKHLTLRSINISDAGLAQLSSIKSLESLTVFGTGDSTIEGFQQLKSLPRLRRLWLYGLGAPGSRVGFAELKQLRELHFEMSDLKHWTQQDLDRLGELLPDARISVGTGGGIYQPKNSQLGTGRKIPSW